MTEDRLPVTEDELHAYVDGQLPADRLEAVSAWLATHPDAAAQVAAWRAQAQAVRAQYGAVINEPVPARFNFDHVVRGNRSWISMAAAAAVAAFLIGGGVGWFAHGATAATPSPFERLATEALHAHNLYIREVRHAVEVNAKDHPHMPTWLSRRVGYELPIPELQSMGLKLVGGRLLPGPDGNPAAFYMYEGPSGERFTIYCSRTNAPDTALRYKDSDRTAALYWVDGKRGYVVSGPADRERMEKITQAIYEQVERAPARNRS